MTSVILAGRSTNRDPSAVDAAARGAVTAYLHATRRIAELDPLTRYFTHIDPTMAPAELDRGSWKVLKAAMKSAMKHTGARAARRLTAPHAGAGHRFILNPPLMERPSEAVYQRVHTAVQAYAESANVDVQMLFRQYTIADIALRAVGVGSVGTRCYVVLLEDGDGHRLILQAKEAGRSVLEQYGNAPQPQEVTDNIAASGEGGRVVGLQRILQA